MDDSIKEMNTRKGQKKRNRQILTEHGNPNKPDQDLPILKSVAVANLGSKR